MLLVSNRSLWVNRFQCSSRPLFPQSSFAGFSIVEGLIASVVVIVAVLGTAAAFNLITSSIAGTSSKNAVATAIDKDISMIKDLSSRYTSCVVPSGSVPANGACDVSNNLSAYYFPQSTLETEKNKFFAACRSSTASSHITAGFVTAINALPKLESGVIRKPAVREDGADPKNHSIIVEYQVNGSTVRLVKVSPVVSSWCG